MSDGYLANGKTILCRSTEADRYQSLADIDKPEVRVMVNPEGLNEKFANENGGKVGGKNGGDVPNLSQVLSPDEEKDASIFFYCKEKHYYFDSYDYLKLCLDLTHLRFYGRKWA